MVDSTKKQNSELVIVDEQGKGKDESKEREPFFSLGIMKPDGRKKIKGKLYPVMEILSFDAKKRKYEILIGKAENITRDKNGVMILTNTKIKKLESGLVSEEQLKKTVEKGGYKKYERIKEKKKNKELQEGLVKKVEGIKRIDGRLLELLEELPENEREEYRKKEKNLLSKLGKFINADNKKLSNEILKDASKKDLLFVRDISSQMIELEKEVRQKIAEGEDVKNGKSLKSSEEFNRDLAAGLKEKFYGKESENVNGNSENVFYPPVVAEKRDVVATGKVAVSKGKKGDEIIDAEYEEIVDEKNNKNSKKSMRGEVPDISDEYEKIGEEWNEEEKRREIERAKKLAELKNKLKEAREEYAQKEYDLNIGMNRIGRFFRKKLNFGNAEEELKLHREEYEKSINEYLKNKLSFTENQRGEKAKEMMRFLNMQEFLELEKAKDDVKFEKEMAVDENEMMNEDLIRMGKGIVKGYDLLFKKLRATSGKMTEKIVSAEFSKQHPKIANFVKNGGEMVGPMAFMWGVMSKTGLSASPFFAPVKAGMLTLSTASMTMKNREQLEAEAEDGRKRDSTERLKRADEMIKKLIEENKTTDKRLTDLLNQETTEIIDRAEKEDIEKRKRAYEAIKKAFTKTAVGLGAGLGVGWLAEHLGLSFFDRENKETNNDSETTGGEDVIGETVNSENIKSENVATGDGEVADIKTFRKMADGTIGGEIDDLRVDSKINIGGIQADGLLEQVEGETTTAILPEQERHPAGQVGRENRVEAIAPALKENAIATERIELENSNYEVRSGDNLWNILKNKLPWEEIGDNLSDAEKENIIANEIRQIGDNSGGEYGTIDSVDLIKPGQEIDLQKIMDDITGADGEGFKVNGEEYNSMVERAESLSDVEKNNIENYQSEETAETGELEVSEKNINQQEIHSGLQATSEELGIKQVSISAETIQQEMIDVNKAVYANNITEWNNIKSRIAISVNEDNFNQMRKIFIDNLNEFQKHPQSTETVEKWTRRVILLAHKEGKIDLIKKLIEKIE